MKFLHGGQIVGYRGEYWRLCVSLASILLLWDRVQPSMPINNFTRLALNMIVEFTVNLYTCFSPCCDTRNIFTNTIGVSVMHFIVRQFVCRVLVC